MKRPRYLKLYLIRVRQQDIKTRPRDARRRSPTHGSSPDDPQKPPRPEKQPPARAMEKSKTPRMNTTTSYSER